LDFADLQYPVPDIPFTKVALGILSRRTIRRRMKGWLALLLPGLLLRSLIPIGFMPMVGADHRVELVVCDSYAPLPAGMEPMDMSLDPSMDMAGMSRVAGVAGQAHGEGAAHTDHGSPVHQDHGTCPYGASPAWGALPTLALEPVLVERATARAVLSAPRAPIEVLPRAQSARGPPA